MRDFHFPGRSSVLAENGMCATSHPLAAQAALEILKNGGNAMDAAIAGAVLLGICEPQMTGIGGDCFILFSPSGSNEIKSMNGSGYAPSLANADELRDEALSSIPLYSAHAVTIPFSFIMAGMIVCRGLLCAPYSFTWPGIRLNPAPLF